MNDEVTERVKEPARLGLQRGGIDAVFRALDVVILPGSRRSMVRVEDYLELIADCTFGDDFVHPVAPPKRNAI